MSEQSILSIGNNSFREISSRLATDPDLGVRLEVVYEGTEFECKVQAANFTRISRAKCQAFQYNGPVWRLTALFGDAQDGSSETAVDKWERVTEYAQFDIRSNPKFLELAGSTETLARWVQNAKDCLKKTPVDFIPTTFDPAATYDAQVHVFNFLAMGGQSYEVKRYVLRRRRTFSLSYAAKADVQPRDFIYTTKALIYFYQIPVAIALKLPKDPDFCPTDCVWSWKERANNSEDIPAFNKTEEVMEWVFAAWNEFAYELVDSPRFKF